MKSDWKKFREMAPILRERYLAEENVNIIRLLCEADKSDTERFWNAEKKAREVARTLRRCLDGHTRSSMTDFILLMLSAGMMKMEDLNGFSEDLRRQIQFVRDAKWE